MRSAPLKTIGRKGKFSIFRYPKMHDSYSIMLDKISKRYRIYDSDRDTLKALFSKRFRRSLKTLYALKDVSFTLQEGENLCILGTRDAGRSTLLKVLSGQILPSSGKLVTSGRVLLTWYAMPDFDLTLSPRVNLINRARFMGLKKDEIPKTVERALGFANIDEYIDKPLRFTPKVERARLTWALYLHTECSAILMDGFPNLAYGKEFALACRDRLAEIMKDPTINVILATKKRVSRINFDKGIVLDKGEMIFSGSFKEAYMLFEDMEEQDNPKSKKPEKQRDPKSQKIAK